MDSHNFKNTDQNRMIFSVKYRHMSSFKKLHESHEHSTALKEYVRKCTSVMQQLAKSFKQVISVSDWLEISMRIVDLVSSCIETIRKPKKLLQSIEYEDTQPGEAIAICLSWTFSHTT